MDVLKMFPVIDMHVVFNFLSLVAVSLSQPQLHHLSRKVQGLLLGYGASNTKVSLWNLASRHQSALNRFQTAAPWDHHKVNRQRIRFLQQRRQTQAIENGLTILDDTLLDKTGKKIEGAASYRDSSKKWRFGHCVVSTHYKDAKKEYPLLFDVYRRKKELHQLGQAAAFQTKLQLAKAQLTQLVELGVRAKTVVFDCWYFAKHFVKFLGRLGLDWVTRPGASEPPGPL